MNVKQTTACWAAVVPDDDEFRINHSSLGSNLKVHADDQRGIQVTVSGQLDYIDASGNEDSVAVTAPLFIECAFKAIKTSTTATVRALCDLAS